MGSDTKKEFKKTRIAPTPSGFLHLGNVFSFSLTAALAAKTNADILLRIDDLDHERLNPAFAQDIFDSLEFLQIPWHSGPKNMADYEDNYSQRHRLPFYQKALERLRQSGKVYACTCSRAQVLRANAIGIYTGVCRHKNLPLETENACWRIDTSDVKSLHVKNLNGETIQAELPNEMRDFVVRKKDGLPAYQLSSVIDDLYFNIDLVVRGEDLWPSTLAQLYLANVLEQETFKQITFYHHPLLSDEHNRKLSKSAGDTSVQYLRRQGYPAVEIYGLLGRHVHSLPNIKSWRDFETYFPV